MPAYFPHVAETGKTIREREWLVDHLNLYFTRTKTPLRAATTNDWPGMTRPMNTIEPQRVKGGWAFLLKTKLGESLYPEDGRALRFEVARDVIGLIASILVEHVRGGSPPTIVGRAANFVERYGVK